MKNIFCTAVVALAWAFLFHAQAAGTGDTRWMTEGKFGIFLHYQYRILLGYSVATKPQFPSPSQMTAEGWNRFVDGFDVKGFAEQMAEGRVGWVLFCLDDHYFAWPCAPNKAFSDFTGYAPGEKCSRRDLILDLAGALNAKGVKLIDWINTCNRQGGVCTLDWPFDPKTGLLRDFGLAQLKRVAQAVKNE